MSEILSTIDGTAYIERSTVTSPKAIMRTKRAIKKAFQTQIDDLGFSMVEILSPCPTNWRMSPPDAWKWIDEEMVKRFPLGVIKDITEKGEQGVS
jgi:2-oxoglutarate ferredoxin oxidoreductase subunit beta